MRCAIVAVIATGCGFRSHVADEVRPEAGVDAPAHDGPPADAQVAFIVQAEAFTSTTSTTHGWIEVASVSGFTGTGLMILSPDNSSPCGNIATVTTCGASLIYDVTIAQPGTYYFFARMWADDGSRDTVWSGVDGAPSEIFVVPQDSTWRWSNADAHALAAGPHTLHIWQREGARVDMVALMPTNDPPP